LARKNDATLLARETYEGLRRAIVRGELRPNERLVEADLAEQFNISRTPIREVLQQLGTEGLVERRRRGWIVHEHDIEEIREIYETRAGLEGYAARLVAERATDEQLERIRRVDADEESNEPRTARDHLVELNQNFHFAVVDAAGNQRLRRLIRQTCEYYFNYRIARLYSDEEVRNSLEQHDELVRRLLSRDADGAERISRTHVTEALEVILAKIR
jgi:DNA-binding GntR family transcriptional regulator